MTYRSLSNKINLKDLVFLSLPADRGEAGARLPPPTRAEGPPGAVGHVRARRHSALHPGVLPPGGRARHFLQAAEGQRSQANPAGVRGME